MSLRVECNQCGDHTIDADAGKPCAKRSNPIGARCAGTFIVPAPTCPSCHSAEQVSFDYTSITSVSVEGGYVMTVEAGGVFGGSPVAMICHSCGQENKVPPHTAEQLAWIVAQQTGFDDDGFPLFRRAS